MGSGRGLGPVRGNWGQGGCEQKIEVIVKMQKCPGVGGPVGGPVRGGGQGGCERRIEVIVKNAKKNRGWGWSDTTHFAPMLQL